jgi:hypothetical protein
MYKKYNSEANYLSPLLEKLTPLLIVAAAFIWLWR